MQISIPPKIDVIEIPTDVYGLSFIPQLSDYDNDLDWAPFTKHCSFEVSINDYNLVKRVTENYMTHGVMEIGVSRNGEGSFTKAMLDNKPDNIKYLGVDLDDKSYLNNIEKNIYTIQENSFNQEAIRNYMKEIKMEKISILFIDGWHSVNACINDWLYADLLSKDGVVIFHDTNYHPGPRVIIESIDRTKFRVERHFVDEDDYGIAIAYKL
jgi:hypothetical protein